LRPRERKAIRDENYNPMNASVKAFAWGGAFGLPVDALGAAYEGGKPAQERENEKD